MTLETKKCQEYLRHNLTDEEKALLSIDMARAIEDLHGAEDELKAIKSDFKSRIDGYQSNINTAARKVSSGYEMRYVECEKVPMVESRTWTIYRLDTGEKVKDVRMTQEDLQAVLPGMEA